MHPTFLYWLLGILMAVCSADHCHNSSQKGFVLVRFPTDPYVRDQWVSAIGRKEWTPNDNNRLCQEHFEVDQWTIYRSSLKTTAVPSRFCSCGFASPSPLFKKKNRSKARADHCYFKPSTKYNAVDEHEYGQSCPNPVDITVSSTDTLQSWSRKKRCPSNCPCRFSHLETCVMSEKVNQPLGTEPFHEKPVLLTKERSSSEKTNSNCAVLSEQTVNCVKTSTQDPAVEKLMKENEALKQRINELKGKVNLPSEKKSDKENRHLNSDQLAALEWGTTKGRAWTTETVRKGLKLRYSCSTSGYKQVIKNVAPFPSVRTLQRKTQHLKFEPGILDEILDAFEVELKDFTDLDKDCVIFWDECAVTSSVEMDRSTGLYIGNVTLRGVKGVAYKALVFMFGGIHRKWKIVVAYEFVPKEGHPELICEIIIELLKRAKNMGLHVKGLVCDMGNRSVLNALGFSLKKDKIIFKIPNTADPEEALYCLPDMGHLLKSAKEMVCDNRIIVLSDEIVKMYNLPSKIVDVGHIEHLHDYQESMDLKMAPKLKASSIHSTHFNKMKIGTATNVINNKTSAGLNLLVNEKIVPPDYVTTAFFCEIVSKWFSYVTSRTRDLALSLHNKEAYDQAIGIIQLIRDMFRDMKVDGGWKPVQTHIIIACEVVLALAKDLLVSGRYDFVMLGRFLQDLVENLLSLIRMQTPNPTPLQFKNRLKQITISQFMEKISNSSYSHDDDRVDGVDMLLLQPKPKVQTPSVPDGLLSWSNPERTCDPKRVVEEGVLYRMCGYVLSRLVNRKSIKCDACISALKRGEIPHERGLFTQITNYKDNAQYEVSDEVFQMCRVIEHNLIKWKQVLKNEVQIPISYLISKFVLPELVPYRLSTCHDVKNRFASAFIEMRMKQFSVKKMENSSRATQDAVALSSKSTGSRLLADNYTPKNKRKSVSLKRLSQLP